jgi:hypothetical protein
MSTSASLEELVALPLTGLRYALSDKLLKINTPDRFNPAKAEQVDGLVQALEAAEVNVSQLWNIKFKTEDLLAAIAEKKSVADKMWDLITSLKIIVADKKIHIELEQAIERLIRDWQGNIFPAEELKHIMVELQAVAKDRLLDQEIDNAFKGITTGQAPRDIRLETPEQQLVWGAHILFLIYNPYLMRVWPESRRKNGFDLVKSALWQQLLACHQVRYLRAIFGSHIYNLLRRTDIMVGWGAPGTWFYYAVNPAPGRINCDLLYSLLVGFDHARACTVHEIGHAVQTRGVPDYIQDLNTAVSELDDDQAMEASQVLRLKQYFLNACEDNCVNRYTAEIGKVLGQDYAYSLNYWYTAIGDVGRRFTRQEVIYSEDSPQQRFKNLTFIISRVFCANNGLFPNTLAGWESLMARPDWIEGRDRNLPEFKLPQEAAFQQLMQMCEEVEYYFPDLAEMAGGPEYYGELAEAYSKKRFELIHEIWQLYAQDLVDQITEQKPDEVDDSMDRFQMEMNHTPPPPKKDKKKDEDKDDQEEEKKNNDDNPNPPSEADQDSKKKMEKPEEEKEGEEKPSESEPDDSGGGDGEDESAGDSAESPPEDSNDSGDDGDQQEEDQEQGSEPDSGGSGAPDKPADKKEKPEKEEKEEKEDDKDRKEKEMEGPAPEGAETKPDDALEQDEVERPEDTEQKDAPAEPPQEVSPEELEALMKELMEQFKELVEFKEDSTAEEEVVEDEENPEAELIREVEDETLPPEQKPEEEKPKDQGGDRGDAKGGNPDSKGVLDRENTPDESMASIEELLEALKANEESEAHKEERRKPQERDQEQKEAMKFDIPPQMSLDQLAKGNWEDFNRRVALHGPVIAVMAKALEKLKDAQLKLIFRVSKKHQLIPPGGDLRRFDQAKMQSLIERISKQEKFDKEHLSMFKKDDRLSAVTRPTRIILIDGSRSMTFGSQPLPMDKAIQEAVIDFMASKMAGYDTYITMFGPLNPILLAEPGDNPVEIGKRIEKVHGGLNTMTYLAPALLQVIEKVAYRKKFEESFVGFTNFVIYTDGDIDDLKASRELIEQIFAHAPKSTFDFVMITDKHATPMDVLIRTVQVNNPIHEIGMVRSTASRHFPLALTATMKLTSRIAKTKSGFADPAFLRTGQFRRLLHLLTK